MVCFRLLLSVLLVASCVTAPTEPCDPYPQPATKKGLQVQMVDDALELGIAHAGLNVDLVRLHAASADANAIPFAHGGREWRFDAAQTAQLDAQIGPLSRRGVVVSLILLHIRCGDRARDGLLLHPRRTDAPPNGICAPDVASGEGRAANAAAVAFLASRYAPSRKGVHGTVWNWICGNEVNSHWWWFHMGRASVDEVVDAYQPFVRLVHEETTTHNAAARTFVSLEHHWTLRYAAGDESQAFAARDFLLRFAACARSRGDFAWHVAFHPYPENLFECRFWNDATAPDDDGAGRVTFKNLPVLARFLAQDALLHAGRSRRVILSEQGFHRRDGDSGERDQAAAFAAAWRAVALEPVVDALILHRHVDHAHEGGLRLGLWARVDGSVCDPGRPTAMRRVFAACDGPRAEEESQFALAVLGIESWSELPRRLGHRSASLR